MNTKELKCFAVAYEEESINKAARKLYITPQGLSRILKNLEEELGVSLFERTQKGVRATECGIFLYEKVDHMIRQFEEIENGVRQLEDKDKFLRIACARGVLNALSFQVILEFIENYPDIQVQWEEYSNNEVKERVAAMKADVGLVVGKSHIPDMVEKKIESRELVLIVYKGHPLYHTDQVSISDLKGEKIIILNEQFQVFHEFKQKCFESGFAPEIVGTSGDSNFIYKLCKLKVGIGVLVDFSMDDFLLSDVKAIPLKEKITWDIYEICKEKNMKFRNVMKFTKYIDTYLFD